MKHKVHSLGYASILIMEIGRCVIQARFEHVAVKEYNKFLIQAHFPWQIQTLVQDNLQYLRYIDEVEIYHIYKEGNIAAD